MVDGGETSFICLEVRASCLTAVCDMFTWIVGRNTITRKTFTDWLLICVLLWKIWVRNAEFCHLIASYSIKSQVCIQFIVMNNLFCHQAMKRNLSLGWLENRNTGLKSYQLHYLLLSELELKTNMAGLHCGLNWTKLIQSCHQIGVWVLAAKYACIIRWVCGHHKFQVNDHLTLSREMHITDLTTQVVVWCFMFHFWQPRCDIADFSLCLEADAVREDTFLLASCITLPSYGNCGLRLMLWPRQYCGLRMPVFLPLTLCGRFISELNKN